MDPNNERALTEELLHPVDPGAQEDLVGGLPPAAASGPHQASSVTQEKGDVRCIHIETSTLETPNKDARQASSYWPSHA